MNNQVQPLQPRPSREVRVVEDNSALQNLFDTARFEHMHRIATAMAGASLIPDHLMMKDKQLLSKEQIVGNCFLVVNQAVRWQMDPFSVAPETYAVGGKLAFQGKLVAAVINARAGLRERLRYTFEGAGDNRKVTVHGTFRDEVEERTVDLTVKEAKTTNQMWTKDPDQKLIYSASVKWARRHCPEIILGVLTEDDLERMASERMVDVTPSRPRPTREEYAQPEPGIAVELAPEDGNEAERSTEDGTDTAPQTAAEEPTHPFTLITHTGEELPFDTMDKDYIKAVYEEMNEAAKGGEAGLTGWRESNKFEGMADDQIASVDTAIAHMLKAAKDKAAHASKAGAGLV
jgi:hypothetical protein